MPDGTGSVGSKGAPAEAPNERTYFFDQTNGDKVGGGFLIPKGHFSRFMGYAPPAQGELSGDRKPSAGRTIEVALQQQMNVVGERAERSGSRNTAIAFDNRSNDAGSLRKQMQDGIDSVEAGPGKQTATVRPGLLGGASSKQYMKMLDEYHAKSKEDNMRYLEMQYKFHYASKSFGTVSNLMKVRHEAVRNSVREIK